jgi:hypothetical protein
MKIVHSASESRSFLRGESGGTGSGGRDYRFLSGVGAMTSCPFGSFEIFKVFPPRRDRCGASGGIDFPYG